MFADLYTIMDGKPCRILSGQWSSCLVWLWWRRYCAWCCVLVSGRMIWPKQHWEWPDDAGSFPLFYIDRGVFAQRSFVSLDQEGVEQLIDKACVRGRETRPDIKLRNLWVNMAVIRTPIDFCERAGLLDYVLLASVLPINDWRRLRLRCVLRKRISWRLYFLSSIKVYPRRAFEEVAAVNGNHGIGCRRQIVFKAAMDNQSCWLAADDAVWIVFDGDTVTFVYLLTCKVLHSCMSRQIWCRMWFAVRVIFFAQQNQNISSTLCFSNHRAYWGCSGIGDYRIDAHYFVWNGWERIERWDAEEFLKFWRDTMRLSLINIVPLVR